MTITVHVMGDDRLDRRDLRQVRQRGGTESSTSVVVQIDTGKVVRLVMNCLFQLGRSEQLTKRRLRERSISRESQRQRIDLAAQRSHASQWILGSSYFLS